MMQFASIVSQITEPMVVFMVLSLLGGWHAGLSGAGFVSYVLYLLFISACIFVVRLRLTKSLHTNWDASDRPKRIRLLIMLLGFSVLFFTSLLVWKNAELMRMSRIFFFWLLGFFLITLRVKISGHMAVTALTLGYLLVWYGISIVPLLLLLPVVGWSRMALGRHTMGEVIGGTVYSGVFLLLISVVSFSIWSS